MPNPYLQLVRPANVVTAMADVLAGFAVAGLENPEALPWLLAASSALYAGGVVLNDVFNRDIDARERPERPIPSGRVPVAGAAWLGGVLLAAGVGLASLANGTATLVAGILAASVLLYDAWGKRQPMLGPVNMGVCRGLNLILGMAAVPAAIEGAWPLAVLSVTYITSVTMLSRGEVFGAEREMAAVSLGLIGAVVAALLVLSRRPDHPSLAATLFTLILAYRVLPAFWKAYKQPDPGVIRQAVRTGVLSLVLLDAVLAAAFAGIGYSVWVLAIGLVAGWLARRFAVT